MSITGRGNKTQSMAQAAAGLADAAAQLAAAAQALSVAAGMLRASSGPPHPLEPTKPSTSGGGQSAVAPAAVNRIARETLLLEERLDHEIANHHPPERGNPGHNHSAATESKGQIDNAKQQIHSPIPVSQTQNNQNLPHFSGLWSTEYYRYCSGLLFVTMDCIEAVLASIMTDSDADLLPTACLVITSQTHVVCYMNCERTVLDVYKHLIEGACGIPVHLAPEASTERAKLFKSQLLHSRKYVLLFPDSFSPSGKLPASSIYASFILVGRLTRFNINSHNASTHILIACREDADLYSSGPSLILGARPWPLENISDELHAAFNQTLSELSDRKKQHVYLDWIFSHGPNGPRYVETWDPVTLVHRANLYLLDVLHYNGEDLGEPSGEFQVSLPRVNSDFVTQNKLELAVEEGVLKVLDEDAAHGTSSGTKLPQDVILLNEVDDYDNLGQSESSYSSRDETERPEVSAESTSGVNQPDPTFQPVLGHRYIAIEEDFDAIPLICFLANKHGRALCFIDDDAMLSQHKSLPTLAKDAEAITKAVEGFLSHTGQAILLLPMYAKNLPASLKQTPTPCAIHWGISFAYQAALKHSRAISCESKYVIMTTSQRERRLEKSTIEMEEHPCSQLFRSQDEHSLLGDVRKRLQSILISKKGLVEKLYGARLYSLARIPRKVLDAETLAQRLNNYSAKFLLHGDAEDGNNTFKPVGGRPTVSRKMIEKFDLKPAVDLGLLSVK
ncbi:hypothetical protein RhiLY_03565 [Ceratobasidium sp. AG-Ba]|nr:hypothetical protein RhiLY_03565 [Ceratobasidium sp. AG-Ba]